MGDIVAFTARPPHKAAPASAELAQPSAEILLFTGVRYERAALPAAEEPDPEKPQRKKNRGHRRA